MKSGCNAAIFLTFSPYNAILLLTFYFYIVCTVRRSELQFRAAFFFSILLFCVGCGSCLFLYCLYGSPLGIAVPGGVLLFHSSFLCRLWIVSAVICRQIPAVWFTV
nr:MAG TPA: hypothetical protein [Caudoviricetes sp.]